ncbi:mpv17-like protein 2 [Phlebotomus argentipes]|uniref:mpv17-like protein 2 n=1 Tax=Phlebotomus argentipes TaxID=94469 RepID=UPI0028937C83|nr:mpv17-like protein 2 [Phlebotomus argentipes]
MLREAVKALSRAPALQRLSAIHRKAFSIRYLVFTNVAISMTLSGVGDVLEQHYQKKFGQHPAWDRRRSVRMGVTGITVGVVCHYWYNFIDGFLPGRTLRMVLKKVVLDQIIGSPLVISTLFITLGALEGHSGEEIIEEMKQKFIRLYTAEWIVWPPAQIINFLWLSPKYRVLYDNTISLGYDVYTSRVANDLRVS